MLSKKWKQWVEFDVREYSGSRGFDPLVLGALCLSGCPLSRISRVLSKLIELAWDSMSIQCISEEYQSEGQSCVHPCYRHPPRLGENLIHSVKIIGLHDNGSYVPGLNHVVLCLFSTRCSKGAVNSLWQLQQAILRLKARLI